MDNKKEVRQKENRLDIYVSKEVKQQLLFLSKLKKMSVSMLCRRVLQVFLSKKNVEKQMLEYALEHIQTQNNSTES